MFRWQLRGLIAMTCGACLSLALNGTATAQVIGPKVDNVPIPANVDPFNLSFEDFKKYSSMKNFELVGQSYFKIPERTDFAKGIGRPGNETGSGFNTVRVYDGIAYLAGYSGPPTLFGILIADVHDPRNMKPLSFIPCNAGARCSYLRVNPEKKILVFTHDTALRANPNKPPAGEATKAGLSFYDVSDPRNPKELAFIPVAPDGKTHGLDMDDRYAYACAQYAPEVNREALLIIDYSDPKAIKPVGTWHVQGQVKGEQYGPLNRLGPDGQQQIIQCHEIIYYHDRIYAAWRDAGMIILDVKDRTNPKVLTTYDYVPPYSGGNLGAAHTSLPVVTHPGEDPDIVVHTDEIFDCPPGFGRILDISDLKNPNVVNGDRPANVVLLSTFQLAGVSDMFDPDKNTFECDPNTRPSTTHLPALDRRSPSLVYVDWYDEGLRALDISNPFAPAFVGYFLSPRFGSPAGPGTQARNDRHTREVFQDPDTNLLYVTDGNGGGLMVLRYTGEIPKRLPIPGAR